MVGEKARASSLERRRKDREKKKELFLKEFDKARGIVSLACQIVNINRDTYYDWRKNDEEFAKKLKAIEERNIDMAEAKLLSAIGEDNLTATIFYLKTKGKNRGYVEQRDNNVNVGSFEQFMKGLPDDPTELDKKEDKEENG